MLTFTVIYSVLHLEFCMCYTIELLPVINLLFVNFVALKIFYPDLIDKTKTPQYTLVSIWNAKWQFSVVQMNFIKLLIYHLLSSSSILHLLYSCFSL